jgi:uncharacterized membrane protein required for colicin V production
LKSSGDNDIQKGRAKQLIMLDIGIALSLVVIAFYGVSAGLILALIDVVVLLLGVFIAGKLYAAFGGVLTFVSDARAAKIIAFAVILVLVIIINEIVTKKAKIREKVPIRKWLDMLLGGIIGLLWAAIFIGALLTVWIGLYPDMVTTTNIKDSVLVPALLNNIPVGSLLPKEFSSVVSIFKK